MSRNQSPFLGAAVSNTDPAHPLRNELLAGQYVRLERLEKDHFLSLYENVGSHPDLWTWWPVGPFNSAEFDDHLQHFLEMGPDLASFAIVLPSGPNKDKAVGLAFAFSEDRLTNRVAELGVLFGPQLQKTRAGTEVVYLLTHLVFNSNYRRLQWKTNSLNLQSRKAAERYGFVFEGTFRQHQINKGRNRDSAWYSIIDSEWPVCKKAFEEWLNDENFDEQQQQRKNLEDIRKNIKKTC